MVPFPDGVQVEFVYSLGGRLATNRIWLWNSLGPTTQAQMDDLAPAVSSFWASGLMPLLAPELELQLVRCRSWDDPFVPLTSFTTPLVSGGASSPTHSANVAIHVLFEWTQPFNNRPNGNFVPGIPRDEVDVNVYSAAIAHDLFEFYVSLIDGARTWGPTEPWYWVNVSLVSNSVLRTEMFWKLIIGARLPSPFVSPQRHRLKL